MEIGWTDGKDRTGMADFAFPGYARRVRSSRERDGIQAKKDRENRRREEEEITRTAGRIEICSR